MYLLFYESSLVMIAFSLDCGCKGTAFFGTTKLFAIFFIVNIENNF